MFRFSCNEICNNNVDDDCNPDTKDACLLASCFDILQADPTAQSGEYIVDPTGGDETDKFAITCDMETEGGGWNVINEVRVINVGSRHAKQETTFEIKAYGYPQDTYQFGAVHVNFRFAGELDDGNNFVNSFFNGGLIGKFKNDQCNANFVSVTNWPRTESVNATFFTMGSQPEGDVDVDCGNGQSYGINEFSLLRFRVTTL